LARITRIVTAALFSLGLLASGSTAHAAAESLVVPDASVLQYGANNDAKVYIRNLNQVDGSWMGCCYNYWIDVSTDAGRAQFSAFLTARASHSRIVFFIADKTAISPFIMVGDF